MGSDGGQFWITFRNVFFVLASLYVLLIIFLYFYQTNLIYFPKKEVSTTPADLGLVFEEVHFSSRDGIGLTGWYIPSESARGTLLFCHGNAGNISHRLDSIMLFNRLRLNVFIFDYRGYGKSGGKPGERGTYLDSEAAWAYLTEIKNTDPRDIVIFGRSLGGAVAADLATRRSCGGVIIESSFTSIKDLAAEIYPFLPVRLLSRYEYNTLDKLRNLRCPKLIIHSRDDEMIGFRHGQRLNQIAKEPKDFLQINGSHNDGFLSARGIYENGIESFLSVIFPLNDEGRIK